MSVPSDDQRERMRRAFDDAIRVSGPAPSAPFAGLRPGDLIGKCRIEKELGRGGMGAVYLARHETLDLPVAVKVLPPHVAAQDPAFAERFLREARLAARLRHPNVVAVMDADVDGPTGLHYSVQEFVDGGSVRDRLRKGPFDEKNGLLVVASLARALVAAAEHDVIHRDIKPDNILLTKDGKVKLADLGLAKQLGEKTGGLTLTESPMGTPDYMSPEQIEDSKHVDARSDLYSLGCTFYHMLTGSPPYESDNVYGVIHRVVSSPVPDPRAKRPELSERSAKLCMSLMAKDPAERPQSASELLGMLKGDTSPPPPRKRVAPKPPTPALRHWLLVLASLVGLSILWFIMRRIQVEDAPAPPPEDPRSAAESFDRVLSSSREGCVLVMNFEPTVTGDGRIEDLSGKGNHGMLEGASLVREGRVGWGIKFDGNGQLRLPPLRERTVAMWVRPDGPGQMGWYDGGAINEPHRAFQLGMFQPGGVNPGASPYPDQPGVFLGFWTIDALVPSTEIVTGWHHVLFTWDGDREVRIAVDGNWKAGHVVFHQANIPVSAKPFQLPEAPSPPADADTLVGAIRAPFWGKGETHFRGTIDELVVWDRPLTHGELTALWFYISKGSSYCEVLAPPD